MLSITALKKGDRVRLVSFGQAALAYRRKLISLGVTPGTTIELLRRAPLGCPVEILVRRTAIALRLHEASCLEWERV